MAINQPHIRPLNRAERIHEDFDHRREALRERLQGAGLVAVDTRYILNHLSHMNDMTHSEWERFAVPHGIEVAWDGMRVCC